MRRLPGCCVRVDAASHQAPARPMRRRSDRVHPRSVPAHQGLVPWRLGLQQSTQGSIRPGRSVKHCHKPSVCGAVYMQNGLIEQSFLGRTARGFQHEVGSALPLGGRSTIDQRTLVRPDADVDNPAAGHGLVTMNSGSAWHAGSSKRHLYQPVYTLSIQYSASTRRHPRPDPLALPPLDQEPSS